MQELLFVIAEVIPMEELIEKLKELSTEYSNTKDQEVLEKLLFHCMIFMTKMNMQKTGKSFTESIADFELARKGVNLLKTEKQ